MTRFLKDSEAISIAVEKRDFTEETDDVTALTIFKKLMERPRTIAGEAWKTFLQGNFLQQQCSRSCCIIFS